MNDILELIKKQNSDLIYNSHIVIGDNMYVLLEEPECVTADGIYVFKIDLKTKQIDKNTYIGAVIDWNISYDDPNWVV